jgi:hypothetical protein
MKLPIQAFAVPALLACVACESAGIRSEKPQAPAAAKSEGGEDAADKTLKKEREVAYARMEQEIAKLSAAAEEREAENAVTEANQKLEQAKKDRDSFKGKEMPTKLAEKQLDVDRYTQRTEESRQELEELEGMYKKEDFASLTKELVINRGRKNLEFAKRGLELAKQGQEQFTGHELPKKEKELDQAVEKAEKGLQEASAKKEKGALENKLKLLKAEHRVDEAGRELDKLKSKDKDKDKEKDKGKEAKA